MTEYTPTLDEIAAATSKHTARAYKAGHFPYARGNQTEFGQVKGATVQAFILASKELGHTTGEIKEFLGLSRNVYKDHYYSAIKRGIVLLIAERSVNELWTFDPREAA